MKTFVLALAMTGCMAAPAAAQMPFVEYHTYDALEASDGAVGAVFAFNAMTQGYTEEVWTIESPIGDIVVSYTSTDNNSCKPEPCADSLAIVAWPPGYAVDRIYIRIDENDLGMINFYPMLGS